MRNAASQQRTKSVVLGLLPLQAPSGLGPRPQHFFKQLGVHIAMHASQGASRWVFSGSRRKTSRQAPTATVTCPAISASLPNVSSKPMLPGPCAVVARYSGTVLGYCSRRANTCAAAIFASTRGGPVLGRLLGWATRSYVNRPAAIFRVNVP